jgi:undecaprenyl diphosphate synthase
MELKIPKISDLNPLKQKKIPLHVAIDARQISGWAEKNNKDEKEVIVKNIEQIDTFINYQIKHSLPVLTLNISIDSDDEVTAMTKFFKQLEQDERFTKNNIRVFVIGRWYDLDTELTQCFKNMMEKTRENEGLFLNLGVKYDGQEEVLGVIKLLAMKAKAGKIDLEKLTIEDVKENLYTSYFVPPNVIIEPSKEYSGLLLWDSKGANIFQTRKHWLDLTTEDVDNAIVWANRE